MKKVMLLLCALCISLSTIALTSACSWLPTNEDPSEQKPPVSNGSTMLEQEDFFGNIIP